MTDVTNITLARKQDLRVFQMVVLANTMGGVGRIVQRDATALNIQVSCSPMFMAQALSDARGAFEADMDKRHITVQSLPELMVA